LQERGFTEKDWKLFRNKIADWQESYMDRLGKEYIELLSEDVNPSDKFWSLDKRIKEDKKKAGIQLEMSRLNLIYNIVFDDGTDQDVIFPWDKNRLLKNQNIFAHLQDPSIEYYGLKVVGEDERLDNIFKDGELEKASVVKEYLTTGADGKNYKTKFYNLDVIITVGYRVKSQRGVQFRIWATSILKEYIKKGFAMDDERLKELGGGGYFKELLARIRDIRASEKVFYRQVLEIYATSVDYNPKAEVSIQFFKRVQNKYSDIGI